MDLLNFDWFIDFFFIQDNTSEEPTAFDRPALSGVDLDITSDLGFDASEIDPKQSADLIVTQDALELIEVMQQVRPKYDENRPDLASREAHSVQSKGKEAEMSPEPLVPDDGFKDVRDALTSVLKKRADDDNEQSLVSSQQKALEKPSLENVFHLFTPVSCIHLYSMFRFCFNFVFLMGTILIGFLLKDKMVNGGKCDRNIRISPLFGGTIFLEHLSATTLFSRRI